MKKLNFSELAQEMKVLSQEETRKIKGGYDDVAFSVMGEEIFIYGQAISPWDNSDLFNVYGSGGGGWYAGGGSWGDYNGSAGCPIEDIKITRNRDIPITQENWYVGLTMMVNGLDMAWSASETAAYFNSAALPAWFRATGRGFAYFGPVDNALQIVDEGFNALDITQLAIGGALIGFSSTLGAPVVLVGGVGLMVWEMYEQYGSN